MVKARKPKWGSELPDDPPGLVAPIASTEHWDLARDPEAEEKAHPVKSLVIRSPASPLGRLVTCEYGAAAAALLALLNLLGLFHVDSRPMTALIGTDPNVYMLAQLAAAALAAGLALLILTRHGLWACEAVLLWSLFELYPPLTRDLYGHAVPGKGWRLALTAVGMAMLGVVGAWSIRRAGPQPKPAPPKGALERVDSAGG